MFDFLRKIPDQKMCDGPPPLLKIVDPCGERMCFLKSVNLAVSSGALQANREKKDMSEVLNPFSQIILSLSMKELQSKDQTKYCMCEYTYKQTRSSSSRQLRGKSAGKNTPHLTWRERSRMNFEQSEMSSSGISRVLDQISRQFIPLHRN